MPQNARYGATPHFHLSLRHFSQRGVSHVGGKDAGAPSYATQH